MEQTKKGTAKNPQMEALKTRICKFEGIPDKTDRQLLDFIFQIDKSFMLLIAGRKNLLDFNVAIASLKSSDYFLILIALIALLYLRYLRYLHKEYIEKNAAVIEKHKPDIDAWADKAIKKLHAMSDEELLKYFTGTSPEDLKAFRGEQDSRG